MEGALHTVIFHMSAFSFVSMCVAPLLTSPQLDLCGHPKNKGVFLGRRQNVVLPQILVCVTMAEWGLQGRQDVEEFRAMALVGDMGIRLNCHTQMSAVC